MITKKLILKGPESCFANQQCLLVQFYHLIKFLNSVLILRILHYPLSLLSKVIMMLQIVKVTTKMPFAMIMMISLPKMNPPAHFYSYTKNPGNKDYSCNMEKILFSSMQHIRLQITRCHLFSLCKNKLWLYSCSRVYC